MKFIIKNTREASRYLLPVMLFTLMTLTALAQKAGDILQKPPAGGVAPGDPGGGPPNPDAGVPISDYWEYLIFAAGLIFTYTLLKKKLRANKADTNRYQQHFD